MREKKKIFDSVWTITKTCLKTLLYSKKKVAQVFIQKNTKASNAFTNRHKMRARTTDEHAALNVGKCLNVKNVFRSKELSIHNSKTNNKENYSKRLKNDKDTLSHWMTTGWLHTSAQYMHCAQINCLQPKADELHYKEKRENNH